MGFLRFIKFVRQNRLLSITNDLRVELSKDVAKLFVHSSHSLFLQSLFPSHEGELTSPLLSWES